VSNDNQSRPFTPATVVLEAGSFLTLLLGGKKDQTGYAYLDLLYLLAERRLIKLVIPDVTVMEVLGTQAPVYKEDFLGSPANITQDSVQYGYSHSAERVTFIKSLLQQGHCTIEKTECGNEYLARLHQLSSKNGFDFNTTEAMRRALLQPKHPFAKLVKNNRLLDERGELTSSGKQDRGELAVADTIKHIHAREGWDTRVFALFEGSDVRGRILQRIASEPNTAAYHQLSGNVLDKFNPNNEKFDIQNGHVGSINFLSTKGFLGGLMYAARELKPSTLTNTTWHIIAHDEATSKDAMNTAYQGIIANVNANGLPRTYNRYRDRALGDLGNERNHEFFVTEGRIEHAPWREYISFLTKLPQTKIGLREVIHDFIKEQQKGLLSDSRSKLDAIKRNMQGMNPHSLATFTSELERTLAQTKSDKSSHSR
jgi:hypothetical protein